MKYYTIILLLIISHKALAQKEKLVFRYDEFLIGMFNDYNGRIKIIGDEKQSSLLTSFYCSQENLSKLFLDTLQVSTKDLTKDIKIENGIIYSKNASEHLNVFYIEKADVDNDSIRFLYLDKNKFETKSQKIAFLAGTFLRYGKLENNKVTLSFANSLSHYDAAVNFIKSLKFKIVNQARNLENTPVGQSIQFIPAKGYEEVFEYLSSIKPKSNICN